MDIENGYYLVKFESAEDYNNVILKGPWVFYVHYLIVQPWYPQFTAQDEFPCVLWLGFAFLGYLKLFIKGVFSRKLVVWLGKL